MTKHAMIAAELGAGGKTVAEIAAAYGVLPAYVRAVRRRERYKISYGTTRSPASTASHAAYVKKRYAFDPEFRNRVRANARSRYHEQKAYQN